MLKIIDRYLISTVLRSTALTLLVLTVLIFILTLIEELEDVGRGDYQTIDALLVSAAHTPYFIYQALPLASLVGALLGLGQLLNQGELIAMRVAGYAKSRILFSLLQAAFLLLLMGLILSEWIAPSLSQYAQSLKESKQPPSFHSEQVWAKDGNAFIQSTATVSPDQLGFSLLYELTPQHDRLQRIILAGKAQYQKYWVFQQGRIVQIKADHLDIQPFKQWIWHSLLDPKQIRLNWVNPYQLSLKTLHTRLNQLAQRGEKKHQYELAFWTKLAMPFNLIALVLLSVPMALKSCRSLTLGELILPGILLGSLFFLFNRAYSFIVLVLHWPAFSLIFFPVLLGLIFYLILKK